MGPPYIPPPPPIGIWPGYMPIGGLIPCCEWHDKFMCDMIYLRCDSFKCAKYYKCDMIHSYVWRSDMWYKCDMIHLYVWHVMYTCLLVESYPPIYDRLIHMRDVSHICDITYSYVWHIEYINVEWLIHVCGKSHIHAHRMCRSLQYMTWLIHTYDGSYIHDMTPSSM